MAKERVMSRYGRARERVMVSILLGLVCGAWIGIAAAPGRAEVGGESERNVSRLTGVQNECAIAVNRLNKSQLFAACNNNAGGLFAARSTDRGTTWIFPDADRTIADGDPNQGAAACCDPTVAWDSFGNLFVTYINSGISTIETLLSTDGGQTFSTLASFAGSVDQPTVVAEGPIGGGATGAVWIVWNQGGQMVARGASVTALGTVGAFGALQTIPGTSNCSFGDIAIAPSGVVIQACETPTGGQGPAQILVNTDTDGLGANNFGAAVVATNTNVGGFDFIPAQNTRSVDAEAGLAYDRNPLSPHVGRLYLIYTEEAVNEGNDLDILVRSSDDDGQTWTAPTTINDDGSGRSQFLPRISTNPLSGNIAACWQDARNFPANNQSQVFCSIATPTTYPTFFANAQISAGTSSGTGGGTIQYGDYAGLDYFQGRFFPVWADQSNSTGDNPDGTTWEAYANRVTGGLAANEGDPHITTVDGVHYDFQAAGEFVVLQAADGFEVQTRQVPVPTAGVGGANPYTGLATCVSVNSAVAVRVGDHRVTYQPQLEGEARKPRMELRVDGVLTALIDAGVSLPGGGRVVRSGVDGAVIVFPDGAQVTATPGFWTSQGIWYLNVDVVGAEAFEGIMGAISPGGWLPVLPDGSSMGPMPANLGERYDDLYHKFGDSWRVTDDTSLFDYAPGTSTKDFTVAGWPGDVPPCDVPGMTPSKPVEPEVAEDACRAVVDKARHEDCVFDVALTGETGFATTYLLTERMQRWGTTVLLTAATPSPLSENAGTFVATVSPLWPMARLAPTGAVQFYLFGEPFGDPVPLDEQGRAVWAPWRFDWKDFSVTSQYLPNEDSPFVTSTSGPVALPDRSDLDVYEPKK